MSSVESEEKSDIPKRYPCSAGVYGEKVQEGRGEGGRNEPSEQEEQQGGRK